jgi:hypothetical protein
LKKKLMVVAFTAAASVLLIYITFTQMIKSPLTNQPQVVVQEQTINRYQKARTFYTPKESDFRKTAKQRFDLNGYQKYLNSLDKNDPDSIQKGLISFLFNAERFSGADRDQGYQFFRNFYYRTLYQYNENFNQDKRLLEKIYQKDPDGTIYIDKILANLNNPTLKKDPQVEKFVLQLWKNGLELSQTEGNFYLSEQPGYLFYHFNGRVSPSLKQFLAIRERELAEGFSEDAGLLISFQALGDRVATWDGYLEKYPASPQLNEAKYYYLLYLYTFLTGIDNSRVFVDGKLAPEVKKAYQDYQSKYPDTKSGRLVGKFYQVLQAAGFKKSAVVDRFYQENEIRTMLGVQPPAK